MKTVKLLEQCSWLHFGQMDRDGNGVAVVFIMCYTAKCHLFAEFAPDTCTS